MSTPTMSAAQEIRLVASRELRTQLFKKSAVISTLVMLVLTVGGIVLYGVLGQGTKEPYRVGVQGTSATVQALTPVLGQVVSADGEPVTVVDLGSTSTQAALTELSDDDPAHVDMVLSLGDTTTLSVKESADDAVVAGVTALLQQQALAQQVSDLGGDPAAVSSAVSAMTPTLDVLEPPTQDSEDFGMRYATLMVTEVLLYLVILGGGQMIAMGVVEEKSSRIVEILLACVRPTSLLAGKVIGIGTAVIASWALLAGAAVGTAKVMDVLPPTDLSLDGVLVAMLVWMAVGYAFFAILFGAAGALVSRQEDVGNVTMPLIMLTMVPYVVSIFMALGDPSAWYWRGLAYVPPFSAFLMPARLALGVSSWTEQGIALAIALAVLPLLVVLGARVYTRAVRRTGARVPLKEVLFRSAA